MNHDEEHMPTVEVPAQPKKRLTLGIVSQRVSEATAWWLGAAEVARQQDVDLFILHTGVVGAGGNNAADRSDAVYHLIDPARLDGLILVQWWPSRQAFVNFYERYYRPLPVVNLFRNYEGYPGVTVDNYQSMTAMLRHLIEVHGYRSLAYVGGPPGNPSGEARYAAYETALAEHDIPLDENLVLPGDYSPQAGINAVRILLDERGLRPGLDFEAIVVSSDYMAVTALEELQRRDIRVPLDVAVVGFDDTADSVYTMPPLTTVRIPNYEMGRVAAETALAIIKGQPFAESVVVQGELMVRQSCGCFVSPLADAGETARMLRREDPPPGSPPEQRAHAIAELSQSMGPAGQILGADCAVEIVDAFDAALAGPAGDAHAPAGRLFGVLYAILRQLHVNGYDPLGLGRRILFALRRCMQSTLIEPQQMRRAEEVWQQALAFVTDVARQMQATQQHYSASYVDQLRVIGEQLDTTFETSEVLDLLAAELPRLDIPGVYIALYTEPTRQLARLALAYNANGRNPQNIEGQVYPARQLLPEALLARDAPVVMALVPLYFQETALGFVLFEAKLEQNRICETLGHQISSALMGALLVQQQEEAQRDMDIARQQAQAALSDLLTTRSISDRVRQAADTEAILRVTLEALRQALGASTAVVRLGTREHLLEIGAVAHSPGDAGLD